MPRPVIGERFYSAYFGCEAEVADFDEANQEVHIHCLCGCGSYEWEPVGGTPFDFDTPPEPTGLAKFLNHHGVRTWQPNADSPNS